LSYETTATVSNQRAHLRDVPHPCIHNQARVVIDLYTSSGGFTIGSPTMLPSINVLVTLLPWGGAGGGGPGATPALTNQARRPTQLTCSTQKKPEHQRASPIALLPTWHGPGRHGGRLALDVMRVSMHSRSVAPL